MATLSRTAKLKIYFAGMLVGTSLVPACPNGSRADSDLISSISFHEGTLTDSSDSVKVFFTRNSTKTDYQAGFDTPPDTPQFQKTLIPSFRESIDLSNSLSPSDMAAMVGEFNKI